MGGESLRLPLLAEDLPGTSAATAAAPPPLPPPPLGSHNPASAATFAWVTPLLHRGASRERLEPGDLFVLPPALEPAACGQRLWAAWRREEARRGGGPRPPSLLRAVVAAWGRPYLALGLLKLAGDSLNFAGPLLLNLLLRHLAAAPGAAGAVLHLGPWRADLAAPSTGYACAAALAGCLVLKVRCGQRVLACRLPCACFRVLSAVPRSPAPGPAPPCAPHARRPSWAHTLGTSKPSSPPS